MPELPLWKPFPTWLHNLRGNRYVTGSNPVRWLFCFAAHLTLACESLRIDGRPFGGGDVAATRTAEFFNVLATFSLGELATF
jgi:hypothetical protein